MEKMDEDIEPEKEVQSTENNNLDNLTDESKKPAPAKNKPVNLILVLSLACITILAVLAICVVSNIFSNHDRQAYITSNQNQSQTQMMPSGRSGQRGSGGMMRRENSTDSSKNMISGVVLSVSDDSFVIGGNGTQYTVKTSDDTTYNTTGKTVSVNDSVVIFGTLSDKTVTATSIRIANQ